jgi:hypothetical protein
MARCRLSFRRAQRMPLSRLSASILAQASAHRVTGGRKRIGLAYDRDRDHRPAAEAQPRVRRRPRRRRRAERKVEHGGDAEGARAPQSGDDPLSLGTLADASPVASAAIKLPARSTWTATQPDRAASSTSARISSADSERRMTKARSALGARENNAAAGAASTGRSLVKRRTVRGGAAAISSATAAADRQLPSLSNSETVGNASRSSRSAFMKRL